MADGARNDGNNVEEGLKKDDFGIECSFLNPSDYIFQTVILLVDDNISHFENDDSEPGQRLYSGLRALKDGLLCVMKLSKVLDKECASFDFSSQTPGNGFRSFSNLVHKGIGCILDMCRNISQGRSSIIPFRKGYFVKEVEAWGQTFASLSTVLDYLINVLLPICENGCLIPKTEFSSVELLTLLNTVSQYSFYGRCLGFHYHESLQKTLTFLNVAMCAFSEAYYSEGGFLQRTKQSVCTGSRYAMDPEQRARRIVDVVQYSSVDFIKSFWSLADTELLTQLPGIVGPSLSVTQQIFIPCEDLETLSEDGEVILIPAPHSHLPPSPISCFLLSSEMREGMLGEQQYKGCISPPSGNIIFHCHGGGFVTHSTKAQEVFLREWAATIKVPIFSIDYSLAPDAKYPRPLEEVLTAYVWMLTHIQLLGSLGKKIILTGDSAGGNLITALTIKCIELGIRRPDGLLLLYTPFDIKLKPTPSRLLAVLDPMLPLGFVLRCLKAYAGLPDHQNSLLRPPEDEVVDAIPTSAECVKTPDDISESRLESGLPEDGQSFQDMDLVDLQDASGSSDLENLMETAEKGTEELETTLSEPDVDTLTTISLTSDPGQDVVPLSTCTKKDIKIKEEQSRRYVAEFLEKYVLTSHTDEQGRKIPILRTASEELEEEGLFLTPSDSGSKSKVERAKSVVFDGIASKISKLWGKNEPNASNKDDGQPESSKVKRAPSFGPISLGTAALNKESSNALLEEFIGVEIVNDCYLSPLIASEQILAQFPAVSILSVEYDFCLDECVTMARLLRSLGVAVTLDVLDQLPHGFLSLNLVSRECWEGCKVAIGRIKGLLGEDNG